uniref:Acyltransferase 3 domain-containing protein n=2 Tax=Culex tarsalis TaxID=7177 RepID=A0A1Q3FSA5_CULTA
MATLGHWPRLVLLVLPLVTILPTVTEASRNGFIELSEYLKFPKVFEYDDFEECRREHRDEYAYCVVHATISPDESSDLYRNLTTFSQDTLHYDHTRLERGVCIQECKQFLHSIGAHPLQLTNDERSYGRLAQACINERINLRYNLQIEPQVQIYHCYTNENAVQPVDALEVLFYVVSLLLVLTVVGSTVYDLRLRPRKNAPPDYFMQAPKSGRDKLLVSFSIPRNIYRLKDPTDGRIRQDLQFFEAFRMIQMCRVVFLHITTAHGKVPSTNTDYMEGIQHQPATVIYIAEFQNYVQTFLSISGMLLTVNFLEHTRKNPDFTVKIFWEKLRGRLCRLIPPYAFVLLLQVGFMKRIMDGPMGQQFNGESQQNCRRWWWTNLLFFNNYVRTDQPCLIQSWYLAADMQLFIYGMAVMMLIWRWPQLKRYIFSVAFVCAAVIPTYTNYVHRITPAMTTQMKELYRYNREHLYHYDMYFPFEQNIGAYSFGMCAGFVYHRYRESRKTVLKSSAFRALFAVATVLYLFSLVSVYWVVAYNSHVPPLLSAVYATLFRQSWPVLTTLIQLALALMAGSTLLKAFFSHPIFGVGGKLSYSVYLIHFTVIELVYGAVKGPVFSSERIISTFVAQIFLWTILCGVGLAVLVELPAAAALKELLDRRKPNPTNAPVQHTTQLSVRRTMNQ